MYVLTVCSLNVTNRVDPIEVFKLVCTGGVISSRRSMVYMSKFILMYRLLKLFGICLLALESILFLNRIYRYRNYFVNNFVRKASHIQNQCKFSRCPQQTFCRKVFLLENAGFQSFFLIIRFISVFA